MDEIGVPERDNEQRLAQYVAAQYDAPAYVRRARQVEEALDRLLAVCRNQREQWLKEVRAQLTHLASLTGDWVSLGTLVSEGGQLEALPRLQAILGLEPPFRTEGGVGWGAGGALRNLRASLHAFNRRWRDFIDRQNLQQVNELRESYNRYYMLEKECALRSARLARLGFQQLPSLTAEDLLAEFPLLPVPDLR